MAGKDERGAVVALAATKNVNQNSCFRAEILTQDLTNTKQE
jgi:hypothetical protein